MGLSLRNIGSRIWDQVNPLDGGLSATTREVDPVKARQSVRNQIRDVFDANTQADQQKRIERGAPQFYKDEQRLTRRDNVQSVEENPFKRIYAEVTEAPRRVGYGLSSTSKTGGDVQDSYLREQRYTQDNELKAVQKINDPNVAYDEKLRWYNYLVKTGNVNQERQAEIRRELGMLTKDADPKAMTAAIAEMGVDVATLGAGSLVFKGAKQAVKQGFKQGAKISVKEARKQGLKEGTKFVGKNIIKPTIPGGLGGGLGAFTSQGSDTTLQQVGLGVGTGVTLSAALPLAGLATDALARTSLKVGRLADTKLSTALNPAAKALQDDYVALNKRWQTATPKMRKNIEKSIKLNRAEFDKVKNVGAVGGDVRPDAPQVGKTKTPTVEFVDETNLGSKSNGMKLADDYQSAQESQKVKYKESFGRKTAQKIKRNVIDPRTVEQSLDNAEFKRLKKEGKIKPGQKQLLQEQSLADQTGLIENPGEAAQVLNKKKYAVGKTEYSVEDVIKHYGKDTSKKAKDFETYRLFKDERWRQNNGAPNTLGLDPLEMDDFISKYEASNKLALEHHEALRMSSLDALRSKRDARIDAPELFENSAKNPYYTPRRRIDPEDLKKPSMTGGVRSGAQTTKGRALTSGGAAESPLSIYMTDNLQTSRALAEQRKGLLLRDKARAGVEFKGQKFTEVLDAEVVIKHKKIVKEMKDLVDFNKKMAAKKANTSADLRVAKTNLYHGGREFRNKMRKTLRDAVDDTDASTAIASLSDKELLEVAENMIDSNTPGMWRVTKQFSKKSDAHAKLALKLEDAKNLSAGVSAAKSDLAEDATKTSQNFSAGTQSYSYRLDGETGKIEIPASYASELDAANKARNKSLLEKGITPVSSAQKIFWTGAFAPVFKTYNVLIKNPIIGFRNADGLSGVGPNAWKSIAGQVLNTDKTKAFKKEMMKRGISYQNAFETRNIYKEGANDIAARANFKSFVARNPVNTMKDLWKAIDQTLAFPDNAQRTSVAFGAYKRAKKLGWSEEAALQAGAAAPAKVYGDFNRVSRLAQDAELIVPYSGAIQSGARALGRATKTKPIQTTLKDATLISTIAGLTAYGIGAFNGDDEDGESLDYYTDMVESGKEYVLDSNFTFVTPWAERDEDGNWSGVIHVPISPDLRPMVKATWRTVYDAAHGEGVSPSLLAGEMFDLFTGDVKDSIYDTGSSNDGENPANAVLAGSPIVAGSKIVAGINPRTGEPLADDAMRRKDRTEQYTDFTSDAAKTGSKLIKGILTPQQIDKYLDTTGSFGDVVQDREEEGVGSRSLLEFKEPFQPKQGVTEEKASGRAHFSDVDEIGKTLQNDDDFRAWQTHNESNSVKTPQDSAAKAQDLLARPELLRAFKDLNDRAKGRGETSDPFFDLSPERQQKVLLYRASKDVNSAKQAYDKDGTPLFVSLGLDEKWYSDYKDKEDARWDEIEGKNKDKIASLKRERGSVEDGTKKAKELDDKITKLEGSFNGTMLTFSGAKKPDDPAMKALQDKYHTLSKGTGERSAFLNDHPELLEFWAQGNQFTNAERVALGLKITDEDGNLIYGGSDSRYGSGSSGPSLRGVQVGRVDVRGDFNYKKPTVSIKKTPIGKTAKAKGPKVSIKKSKV